MRQTLKLTGAGFLALGLGAIIYVVVRPEGSSYLSHVVHYALPVSLETLPFINNLPSFFHVFGFSLLTVAILAESKHVLVSCLFWLFVNVLFEFGQHHSFVQWLDVNRIQLVRVLESYFRLGTFDELDILFSVLGCMAAYGGTRLTDKSIKQTCVEGIR